MVELSTQPLLLTTSMEALLRKQFGEPQLPKADPDVVRETQELAATQPAPVSADPPAAAPTQLVDPKEDGLEIVLLRRGAQFYLCHRGTGECLLLAPPAPGALWRLGWREPQPGDAEPRRHAFVAQFHPATQATSDWKYAEELFALRLGRAPVAPACDAHLPHDRQGLFVRDSTTRLAIWRSEQVHAKIAKGISHYPLARPGFERPVSFHAKVWVYQIERGPSQHLLLELPWLHDMLEVPGTVARWLENNRPTWERAMQRWSFGAGNYQRGSQGARKANAGVSGAELAELVWEPGGTVMGWLIAGLHRVFPINDKERKEDESQRGHQVRP